MAVFYVDFENVQSAGLEGAELLTSKDTINILYSNHADSIKIDTATKLFSSKAKVKLIKAVNGTLNALDFQLVALLFMQIKKKTETYIVSKDTGFNAAVHMGQEMGYEKIERINSLKDYVTRKNNQKEPGIRTDLSDEAFPFDEACIGPVQGNNNADDSALSVSEPYITIVYNPNSQELVDGTEKSATENQGSLAAQIAACADIPKDKKQIVSQAVKKSSDKAEFYRFFIKEMGQQSGRELYLQLRSHFDTWKSLK